MQNVLLFVPFGALGVLSGKRTKRFELRRVLLVTALGAALSVFVEALQLFMTNRVTSVSDVAMNTTGALLGAFGADRTIRGSHLALRRMNAAGLVDERTFYPMMVAVIVVCVFAWQPFDVALDVSTFVSKVRLLGGDLWQFTVVTDEGIGFVQYALLAAAVAAWLSALGRPRVVLQATTSAIALALVLEVSQMFITSRMPGLEDVSIHAAGAVTGALLWRWDRQGRWRRAWPVVVSLGIGVGAALLMLSPFVIAPEYRQVRWLPFFGYYENTTFGTLSHVVELLLLYFPVGFCFAQVLPPRLGIFDIGRRRPRDGRPGRILPGLDRWTLPGRHRRPLQRRRRLAGGLGSRLRRFGVPEDSGHPGNPPLDPLRLYPPVKHLSLRLV